MGKMNALSGGLLFWKSSVVLLLVIFLLGVCAPVTISMLVGEGPMPSLESGLITAMCWLCLLPLWKNWRNVDSDLLKLLSALLPSICSSKPCSLNSVESAQREAELNVAVQLSSERTFDMFYVAMVVFTIFTVLGAAAVAPFFDEKFAVVIIGYAIILLLLSLMLKMCRGVGEYYIELLLRSIQSPLRDNVPIATGKDSRGVVYYCQWHYALALVMFSTGMIGSTHAAIVVLGDNAFNWMNMVTWMVSAIGICMVVEQSQRQRLAARLRAECELRAPISEELGSNGVGC